MMTEQYDKKMERLRERAKREASGETLPDRSGPMPTIIAVARYWSERGVFHRVDWYHPGCFACGDWSQHEHASIASEWTQSRLERCHLIAASEGGSRDVSNIVLLCKGCHRKAPMCGVSAQPMIDWINRQEYYIVRIIRRIEEEVRAIRPTLPEEAIALGLNDYDKLEPLVAVAAHSMRLGYHADGDMIASGAAVLCSVVDALKK